MSTSYRKTSAPSLTIPTLLLLIEPVSTHDAPAPNPSRPQPKEQHPQPNHADTPARSSSKRKRGDDVTEDSTTQDTTDPRNLIDLNKEKPCSKEEFNHRREVYRIRQAFYKFGEKAARDQAQQASGNDNTTTPLCKPILRRRLDDIARDRQTLPFRASTGRPMFCMRHRRLRSSVPRFRFAPTHITTAPRPQTYRTNPDDEDEDQDGWTPVGNRRTRPRQHSRQSPSSPAFAPPVYRDGQKPRDGNDNVWQKGPEKVKHDWQEIDIRGKDTYRCQGPGCKDGKGNTVLSVYYYKCRQQLCDKEGCRNCADTYDETINCPRGGARDENE